MPLFDFVCTKCGATFEDLLPQNASTNPPCPRCGDTATERKVAAPSPLKTGAFPYKVGPVRPLSTGAGPSCASCGMHNS